MTVVFFLSWRSNVDTKIRYGSKAVRFCGRIDHLDLQTILPTLPRWLFHRYFHGRKLETSRSRKAVDGKNRQAQSDHREQQGEHACHVPGTCRCWLGEQWPCWSNIQGNPVTINCEVPRSVPWSPVDRIPECRWYFARFTNCELNILQTSHFKNHSKLFSLHDSHNLHERNFQINKCAIQPRQQDTKRLPSI